MNRAATEIQLHETPPDILYRIFTVQKPANLNYWHAETELIMLLDSELVCVVNSREYRLKRGDLLLIPGGDIHRMDTPVCKHLVLQFDMSTFESKVISHATLKSMRERLERLERCSQSWPEPAKSEITDILLQMQKNDESPPEERTAYILKVQSLLYRLINVLYGDVPQASDRSQADKLPYDKKMLHKLERVLEYIKNHYGEAITLETAAQVANYSVNHFTKIWLRYIGTHFHTYLNSYRINEAMTLLKDTGLSITEIAARCGFGSYKTFIRLFKSHTGMSAAQYRKQSA